MLKTKTPRYDLPNCGDIRRILVIKWSAMGDVIISTALFQDIRLAFPDAEIDLNALPPWERLFQHDKRFRKVFSIDLRGKDQGWRGIRRWLGTVRQGRYDLVIDLQSNDRSRIMLSLLWLAGVHIPYRVGNHIGFPYNIQPESLPKTVHAYDCQRYALQAAGIPTSTPRPVLQIDDINRRHAHDIMHTHDLVPGNYAVFMPGCQAAGWLKRWGANNYAALAIQLHEAGLEKIVLIGGKDEMDECERIHSNTGDFVVNLCGQTEILDIVPLSESARLIVANDTGTAHIASCADRPMIVICGPTDPRRVKPLGDNVKALQADIYCINCYRKTCVHHSCMMLISPQQVFEQLGPALRPA